MCFSTWFLTYKNSSPKWEPGLDPKFTTRESHTSLPRSRSHNGCTNPRNKPQTIPKRKQEAKDLAIWNSSGELSAVTWRTVHGHYAEPPVLVLWLNQVTRQFFGEPSQTPCADSGHEPLPFTGSVDNFVLVSCHHAAHTWPRWPPGPSSQAYLSLHSSEAPQGIDLSCPLFTCTKANQVITCTCNTQPRVRLHHVVNHSSQPGATIHRSSDAPFLNLPLDECIDNTHK
jgi:hypothetical protein